MSVPFLDLGAGHREIAGELEEAALRVLRSGWYVLGPELESFEACFAAYCGVRHCVGVGSGFDALELCLRAWDIGPGDEVIVPSNTYIATWLAVSATGATPVPVEPREDTYNIDAEGIAQALSPRTRAIVPVHLYGQPADMAPIMALARERGLRVLEDAAQAHGARCRGRRAGALADAAAFSFYPSKNLGALGDGGAVTTDDPQTAARLRLLRNYGSGQKYAHAIKGRNSRLDPLQAALLLVKLRRLDEWNARRAQVAARYLERLAGSGLGLPAVPEWAQPAWHLFVVRSPQRARLQARLREKGIDTLVHYPLPPHLQPAYADLRLGRGALPVCERLHDAVLSLPIGPHMDPGATDAVVDALLQSA